MEAGRRVFNVPVFDLVGAEEELCPFSRKIGLAHF